MREFLSKNAPTPTLSLFSTLAIVSVSVPGTSDASVITAVTQHIITGNILSVHNNMLWYLADIIISRILC